MSKGQYFQGDLMFEFVGSLDSAKRVTRRQSTKLILARGEKSGHQHVVVSPTAALSSNGDNDKFLTLFQREWVVQESTRVGPEVLHEPLELEAGIYRMTQQRHYAPEKIIYGD